MVTFPKLVVSTYPEMLRKLAASVFIVTVACVTLIRWFVPAIDEPLREFESAIPPIETYGVAKVAFSTFAIAFLTAWLSEAVRLHDKISDALGIRRDFDIRWILIPMAFSSGASASSLAKIEPNRHQLMSAVFYEYVSGTPGKATIDSHGITQALTAWSNYWLLVEASTVLLVTSAILAYFGALEICAGLLLVVLLLIGLARWLRTDCVKYASAEVRAILADSTRATNVRNAFNAL